MTVRRAAALLLVVLGLPACRDATDPFAFRGEIVTAGDGARLFGKGYDTPALLIVAVRRSLTDPLPAVERRARLFKEENPFAGQGQDSWHFAIRPPEGGLSGAWYLTVVLDADGDPATLGPRDLAGFTEAPVPVSDAMTRIVLARSRAELAKERPGEPWITTSARGPRDASEGRRGGDPEAPPPRPRDPAGESRPAGTRFWSGVVRIDPALGARVPPGARVFVLARGNAGDRGAPFLSRVYPPVFPFTFELTSADTPAPGMEVKPMSGFLSVLVSASGSVSRKDPDGDFVGRAGGEVPFGAADVEITISMTRRDAESGGAGSAMPAGGDLHGASAAESRRAAVRGVVDLPEDLRGALREGMVLFLTARRGDGAIALVERISSPEFPLAFALGSADTFEAGTTLTVGAHLDGDGDAITHEEGDLWAASDPAVPVGATDVRLRLGRIRK